MTVFLSKMLLSSGYFPLILSLTVRTELTVGVLRISLEKGYSGLMSCFCLCFHLLFQIPTVTLLNGPRIIRRCRSSAILLRNTARETPLGDKDLRLGVKEHMICMSKVFFKKTLES